MVAIRGLNLRSGDIAESLGLLLLQGIALVAPVPRTEDVGIDVVATLIRRDGQTGIAESSLSVSLKSTSVRSVSFSGATQVQWIKCLDLPFFVGSVDRRTGRIALYCGHGLTQVQIETVPCNSIELFLDEDGPKGKQEPADGRHLFIGPPVLTWGINDLVDDAFLTHAYLVLNAHLAIARRNLELCRTGRFEIPGWNTGEVPVVAKVRMISGGTDQQRLTKMMNLAMPYLSGCFAEADGSGESALVDKILEVAKEMARLGSTVDPILQRRLANANEGSVDA